MKLAFTRNLLKFNSNFKKKITHRSKFAASEPSAMWLWHCVVDVSYPRLSDWTCLQCSEHCTASTRSGRVHFLPWGVATRLFLNDFREDLFCVVNADRYWICWWRRFRSEWTTGKRWPFSLIKSTAKVHVYANGPFIKSRISPYLTFSFTFRCLAMRGLQCIVQITASSN